MGSNINIKLMVPRYIVWEEPSNIRVTGVTRAALLSVFRGVRFST